MSELDQIRAALAMQARELDAVKRLLPADMDRKAVSRQKDDGF